MLFVGSQDNSVGVLGRLVLGEGVIMRCAAVWECMRRKLRSSHFTPSRVHWCSESGAEQTAGSRVSPQHSCRSGVKSLQTLEHTREQRLGWVGSDASLSQLDLCLTKKTPSKVI